MLRPVALSILVSLLLVVESMRVILMLLAMILVHFFRLSLNNLLVLIVHKDVVVLRRVWESDWAASYLIFMIFILSISCRL